jgi:hypothetical protein
MADKRKRRSHQEILKLRRALVEIVQQHSPLTVRHLFYLAVALYLIQKTEVEYRNVIIRLADEMREDWLRAQDGYFAKYQVVKRLFGRAADHLEHDEIVSAYTIPFGDSHIVDAGRWIHKPRTHNSIQDALRDTAEYYRRALWSRLPVQVHVFCEKDAIADLVYQETAVYDVPLAVMRGDSSKTFLWECAAAIRANRRKVSEEALADEIEQASKLAILYFLVDYDDKGRDIIRSAVQRIQRYARKADIQWEVLAITQKQIEQYKLPTRPRRKTPHVMRSSWTHYRPKFCVS